MDAVKLDTGNRWANAGIAAGIGGAAVAAPMLAGSTILSRPVYGEAFARTVGRNALPTIAAFGVPMAVGAMTGSLLDDAVGSPVAAGAIGGANAGVILGATVLHPVLTKGLGGNAPSRMVSAAVLAGTGALMGAFGGAMADATVE